MNQQQAQAQYDKAVRLHNQGKVHKAIQLYRKVLKSFPNLDGVHTNLGMALYQLGKFENAMRSLDKAIKINPTNLDAYRNRAATLMAMGRLDEAEKEYATLVKTQPDNANFAYNYGFLLYQRGKGEESEKQFLNALKAEPQFAQAHYNLGYLYVEQKRFAEAENCFRKAIAAKPDYAVAYLNLANLEADQGKLEAALRNYQLAVEVQPDFVMGLNGLARAHYEMGNAAKALSYADQALALDAKDPNSWVMKGNALSALGDEEGAKAAFAKALEIDPDHVVGKQNLARSVSRDIPSWHFTMLADEARNKAYRKAIESAVKEGDRVLDIGTGSGLLAMMAARTGAHEVVGCEMVGELASVAKEVIAANGYSDRIRVISANSNTIKVGEELPEQADVLVSEILDAAVIGEGVLPSHRHAVDSLLKPNGKVIPARAECYVQLVALPGTRSAWPVGEVEGFDLSGMQRFQRLDQAQVVHLAREDWDGLTEVSPLWQVDFARVPRAVTEEDPETWPLELTGTADGSAHAVVLWFDLWVDDETMVSTKPGGDLRHWGQSVYYFPEDVAVKAGGKVKIQVTRGEMTWKFAVT